MSKGNGKSKRKQIEVPEEVLKRREQLIDESDLGLAPEEGFEDLVGERVVGWFIPAAGNVLQGTLSDMFETESKFRNRGEEPKKKKVYKFLVSKVDEKHPTMVLPADPENDDEAVNGRAAQVGDLIGVDERGFLKSLERVAIGQEVWIACLGKMPRSADYPQGAWKYVVRAKPVVVDEVTGVVTAAPSTKSDAKASGKRA